MLQTFRCAFKQSELVTEFNYTSVTSLFTSVHKWDQFLWSQSKQDVDWSLLFPKVSLSSPAIPASSLSSSHMPLLASASLTSLAFYYEYTNSTGIFWKRKDSISQHPGSLLILLQTRQCTTPLAVPVHSWNYIYTNNISEYICISIFSLPSLITLSVSIAISQIQLKG